MADTNHYFPLFLGMYELYNAHKEYCIEGFRELGLTPGLPKVLSFLLFEEGVLQKDLAAACKVEPATMTTLLAKLQSMNLIEKQTVYVSGGKRAFAIYLTEKGRIYGEKVAEISANADRLAVSDMSEEEQTLLYSLLHRAATQLSNTKTQSKKKEWKDI